VVAAAALVDRGNVDAPGSMSIVIAIC